MKANVYFSRVTRTMPHCNGVDKERNWGICVFLIEVGN